MNEKKSHLAHASLVFHSATPQPAEIGAHTALALRERPPMYVECGPCHGACPDRSCRHERCRRLQTLVTSQTNGCGVTP